MAIPPRIAPSTWEGLRDRARGLGFADLGSAPVVADLGRMRAALREGEPATAGLSEWIAAGRHGGMGYMERTADLRLDPRAWWPPARTALVGLISHDAEGEPGDGEGAPRGRLARYAWGRDYHLVVKALLMALGRHLEREVPGADWRLSVDRGAVMEKPLAVLAGLGWIGKHGNLLRTDGSSWFFIGVLLTNAELDRFEPFTSDHCGTCTACIDACPTAAIVAPGEVDARRCISYLTIEHAGTVDPALREGVGSWIFGCDACQDACPWNSHRTRRGHGRFAPGGLGHGPLLSDVLRWDAGAFAAATPKSPLKRARRSGLVKSAALAAGNAGDPGLVADLARLMGDEAAAVRAHAAWSLGRLGGRAARSALEAAAGDRDPAVRAEIRRALEMS